jgi:guanosine-3',5'-bis(diphosphate) 3'-pyrophosphohydrolase
MTTADDLIGLIRAYNPSTNAELITKAYHFCRDMHEGQSRRSGEPYYTHPVAVAVLLADQYLDDASIITALLHDTIEDTKANFSDIERMFTREVAELVDGVTKITNLQLSSTVTKQADYGHFERYSCYFG